MHEMMDDGIVGGGCVVVVDVVVVDDDDDDVVVVNDDMNCHFSFSLTQHRPKHHRTALSVRGKHCLS